MYHKLMDQVIFLFYLIGGNVLPNDVTVPASRVLMYELNPSLLSSDLAIVCHLTWR